jgi:hypothetical protein
VVVEASLCRGELNEVICDGSRTTAGVGRPIAPGLVDGFVAFTYAQPGLPMVMSVFM